ncbi:SWIM zinc finger family protein [Winogradskya consettensis]|uniref:SWIM zinc finger family protein n=1 Tax=Winogradskya consettensis TaxID=113560 RepID=UPI001BB441A3|nr:SWIM zinc finger family protein [Actinoplanes consettensis]
MTQPPVTPPSVTQSPVALPPVPAAVTADAVSVLPARLRSRLDQSVAQATTWPVRQAGAQITVHPDDRTTITLSTPVTTPADATCSCLLSPRCLHRAAVLSAAPVAPAEPAPNPQVAAALPPAQVSDAQRDAARGLWSAAAAVLSTGIPGAGAVAQADLLRAVHQARATGLHTPATYAIRVVEHLRSAHHDNPAFRLSTLTDDLRDLLTACHRVSTGDASATGVARRDYEPVGDLRLHGLFCEPVRAATGHAGAVTYLADANGRLWVISDIKPATPDTAAQISPTGAPVDLGEVRLSHHDLSRAGLLAVNAHASPSGRLSHGRARQAVRATGSSWFDPPLATLWTDDHRTQTDRWLQAATLPDHARPATHDLAFLDGTILGSDHRGLLLSTDRRDALPSSGRHTADERPRTVVVTAPYDDPSLPYVANLRKLATHATGSRIRLIARFTGPRRVAALAFTAGWLPTRHGGHLDLGTTSLTRTDLPTATPPAQPIPGPEAEPLRSGGTGDGGEAVAGPPLHLVRYRLERVVAGGRSALVSGVADDSRRLAAAQLGTAVAVVDGLGAAGVRRTRDVFGRLDPHDAERLAVAWLTAAVYELAAGREMIRAAWDTGSL